MKIVYACGSERVALPGGGSALVPKGSHWSADDPVVRARPDLFSTDPRFGLLYSIEPEGYGAPVGAVSADAPVEQATAAPGEKRQVRRG